MKEEGIIKMKEFISGKKWHFISGGAFLVILAIIMGVFVNSIYLKLDSVQKQNDLLSSNVKSLENSSSALKSSIGDLTQNTGVSIGDQALLTSLKADLEGVFAELSEVTDLKDSIKDLIALKTTLDQLNDKLKNLNSGTASPKPVENGTTTIPDSNVPGNPAAPSKPLPGAIIKAGQEITVTVYAGTVSDMYGYQFDLNFDKSKVSYKSGLKSSISGISTIFKKDNPDYLLIGATMIGDKQGYSGNDVNICTLVFAANADCDLSSFGISEVSTVDSTQKYVENISGWSCKAKAN